MAAAKRSSASAAAAETMDSSQQQQQHGCSPWLCGMDSMCFFSHKEQDNVTEEVPKILSLADSDEEDDPTDVMDTGALFDVEVCLEDYCSLELEPEIIKEEESPEQEKPVERQQVEQRQQQDKEQQSTFQERIKVARQEQNKRYFSQQRQAQARMAAKAKEARRLKNVENKKNEKVRRAMEKQAVSMQESLKAQAGLNAGTDNVDRAQGDKNQGEDETLRKANEEEDKEEEPRLAADQQEQQMKKAQEEEEKARIAAQAKEAGRLGEELARLAAREEEEQQRLAQEQAEKEQEEAEKAKNAAEAKAARKEARRVEQQKAAEAEERMKKAREEQRKLYQKQHEEDIRRKTEEAKEARRLATQEKLAQQKKEAEEEKAQKLSDQRAEAERMRQQMESTKQQRAAWQSQQAAATAAQRDQWQKDWHAKQEQQHASYQSSSHQQQVPLQPPVTPPPVNSWHPQPPPPSFQGAHERGNETKQHQWNQAQSSQYQASPNNAPHQQYSKTAPAPPQQPSPSKESATPSQKASAAGHGGHQPGQSPRPAPSTQSIPVPPTDVKVADNNDEQEAFTTIKRNVLTTWALQPPALQILRPIQALVTSIHTVFPTNHEYFDTWTPITNVSESHKKLKKAVRKIRFFLHPDKLPNDLNEEQLFLCKLLWDVTNDAWEHYNNATEELDWTK